MKSGRLLLRLVMVTCVLTAVACGISVVGVEATAISSDAGDDAKPRDGMPGPVRDSGPGVDASPSPSDASACAHDCGGGACVDGRCTPWVIAEGIPAPWYVAVDESQVYVTSHVYRDAGSGALYAIPKDGGGDASPLVQLVDTFDVLVGDASLVVSSVGEESLFRVSKAGNAQRVWDAGKTLDLTQRAGNVYFTARSPENHDVRALTPEGAVSDLRSISVDGVELEGIVIDATHIYYADRRGWIGRVEDDGSDPRDDWHAAKRVRRLAIDEDAVYWTSDTSAFRVEKDGGGEIVLVDNVGYGTIVIDGEYAYITVADAGRVVRVNKRDGGGLVELATGLGHPLGLAVDRDSLYFTERDRGRVWRMMK